MLKLILQIIILFILVLSGGNAYGQIDSLKDRLEHETEEVGQISRLIEIADVYIMIDTDSALYYCDSAMELILNQEENIAQQIKVLILKSELFCLNGDFDKAMHYAESAKQLVESINNKSLVASIKLAFANIYIALSFYDIAYENCISAMELYKSQNDLPGQRKCYTYLGSLSLGSSLYDDAIGYFDKALSLARKIDDKLLLACSYSNMGTAYAYQKNTNQALLYYNYSLKISAQFNLSVLLLHNYINFAVFYMELQSLERSEEYCKKAIQLANKNKNWRLLCTAMNIDGQNKKNTGKYREALACAYKSDSLGRKLNLINELNVSSLLLSELYAQVGKNDSALKYYKEYSVFKDSLYDRKNQVNIQRIKFEYQIKEQMLAQKLSNQKVIALVFGLLVALIAIIIRYFVYVRNNRRRFRKIELDLDSKNREITSKMVYIQKKNEAIANIAGKLEESRHLLGGKSTHLIDHAIKELFTNSRNDSWEEFELRFKEVDPDFFKKLAQRFPYLTPNDKKLCAYLKLNLSTKEIANLLGLSVNSVLSARYRLRKKLDINKADMSINQFLDVL